MITDHPQAHSELFVNEALRTRVFLKKNQHAHGMGPDISTLFGPYASAQ